MSITVYEGTVKHEVSFKEGESVLSVLQNAGIQSITAPCGGNGTCGKCGVNIQGETDSALRLGGGFGAFAHRRNSALLGIIPQECKGKTVKLGNTSLAGAISAALSEEARAELLRIQKLVQVIDLPTHPSFNDAFTDAMFFE